MKEDTHNSQLLTLSRNYGQWKTNALEKEKVVAARSLAEKELLDEGEPIK